MEIYYQHTVLLIETYFVISIIIINSIIQRNIKRTEAYVN